MHDARDLALGTDSNAEAKREIIKELLARLSDKKWLSASRRAATRKDLELAASQAAAMLKGSQLSDLTEFGRSVHAEMSALLSAARNGVPVQDSTLYVTLFPCHNCAKHVITSGVKRVVYIEPYLKSRALQLHGDAIALEGHVPKGGHVVFEPFVGIAPCRYADFFGYEPRERKELLERGKWVPSTVEPRFTKAGGYYRNMHVNWEPLETDALYQQMKRMKLEIPRNGHRRRSKRGGRS